MIETDAAGIAESSNAKVVIMEQEDGEVSDASNCDINDEGEIVDEEANKSRRKENTNAAKADVCTFKKTALEKLKNMSFSSRSKLPVRSSSIERRERERRERQTTSSAQQHSPRRDNDEERRLRKRRWEDRNDEQERQQIRSEDRPRPLRDAIATPIATSLPIISRPIEPSRPMDQPLTLRQRVDKVINVQESEAVNMSDKELRNLIARMCDLSKEQERLLRGRQIQFDTLREIYKYVKDDIEKLYARVPAHMRMDLPLPPQALHPSAPSSGGLPQLNGGASACQLEQRVRIPSLFDVPNEVSGTNIRMNSGIDLEVDMRNEGGRSGGSVGFSEQGSSSNGPQRAVVGRNGVIYGDETDHAVPEDIDQVGVGCGGTVRNGNGSNQTNTLGRVVHTVLSPDQTVHSVDDKRPFFSGLSGPGHLEHLSAVVPSTSSYDSVLKPLFNRQELGESSKFSGCGSFHEAFSKIAEPSSLSDSFSDHPSSLVNYGNSSMPNQASLAGGRQMFDALEQSSAYTMVQTNFPSKMEPGGTDGGIRAVSHHNLMHVGLQGANSFVTSSKPRSPGPTLLDFPPPVSLRTVVSSANTENASQNTFRGDSSHSYRCDFKQNEVSSGSQAALPNLSEPPPPFASISVNSPGMLSNNSGVVPLNALQNLSLTLQPAAPSTGAGFASAYSPGNASPSIQPLSSAATTTTVNALSASCSTLQNLPSQSINVTSATAPLLALRSGSTAVSIPPPDFSVPPPVAPLFSAQSTRTNLGGPVVTSNLINQPQTFGKESMNLTPVSVACTDSRTKPSSNPSVQRSLHVREASMTDTKGVLANKAVLSGLPSMNVPPPSFSIPPPRVPAGAPPFSAPPPMAPSASSGSRLASLAPSMSTPPSNLISASVNLNCPPPDISQPPPNIRNSLSASNPESVHQMVSAIVNQSAVSGQSPVEMVNELIANAYSRTGGLRLHDTPLGNQRMPIESTGVVNKTRTPAPTGPPRPLSSIGKLAPPLRRSPSGAHGGPALRSSNFNKQKGSQNRPLGPRTQQQRQKRLVSEIVAIVPDEHDQPGSSEGQNDNTF